MKTPTKNHVTIAFLQLSFLLSLFRAPTLHPIQILYSLKSRCGKRLERGDFDRSSDALVLAVRDRSGVQANPSPATPQDGGGGGGGGSESAGEIVAVVELTIRQPDGKLPYNWPFPVPWRRAVSMDQRMRRVGGDVMWPDGGDCLALLGR